MKLKRLLDNKYQRNDWIEEQLSLLPENTTILDAGCGRQPYRDVCEHLNYYAQDFGRYEKDEKDSLTAGKDPFVYGRLDYTGNIRNSCAHSVVSGFFYHYLRQRHPSRKEVNTLCFGYHVTAVKERKRSIK